MTDYVQAISTLGFPIVACIALYINNIKLAEAINNNTVTITKLCEKLDK